jgi:hypothetical protein
MSNIRKCNRASKIKQYSQASKKLPFLGQQNSIATDMLQDGTITEAKLASAVVDQLRPTEVLQDFTTIGNIGDASQQMAGHLLALNSFGGGTPDGLWLLDNLTDDSGGANTLTDGHSTAFTGTDIMGSANKCANLDGTNDFLYAAGSDFDDSGSFTAGFYIYPHRTGTNETFIGKYSTTNAQKSWLVQRTDTGSKLEFVVWYNNADGYINIRVDDEVIPSNIWSQVVAIYNQSTTSMQVYVNGVLVMSAVDAVNLGARNNNTTAKLTIGALDGSGTPSNFYDGLINCAFYCKYAMTQKEVEHLYATRYAAPAGISGTDYLVSAIKQRQGDSDYTMASEFPEIARNSSYIYRQGRCYSSDDKVRIIVRE